MLQPLMGLLKNRIVWGVAAVAALGGGGWAGTQYMGWNPLASASTETAAANEEGAESPGTETQTPLPGTTPVANRPPRLLMVGSFNIQRFGETKASKPEVMAHLETIALPFDVLAIQEVQSKDKKVIKDFIEALNQKHQAHFNYVTSPFLGSNDYKESYAFIYDTSRVSLVETPFYIADPEDKMMREPLVARFQVRNEDPQKGFSFALVNVHTRPKGDGAPAEVDFLSDVVNYLQEVFADEEDDILLLGDFNLSWDEIRTDTKFKDRSDWEGIISGDVTTNILQTASYDNILYRPNSTREYQGRSGVINLMEKLRISVETAGDISDHMPIWAAFSLEESPTAIASTTDETQVR